MVPGSRYDVVITSRAERQIRKLPLQVQPDVIARTRELADDPRGHQVKKLVGRPEWRAVIGDYRIVFVIDDDAHQVVVTVVAHRREVYDR